MTFVHRQILVYTYALSQRRTNVANMARVCVRKQTIPRRKTPADTGVLSWACFPHDTLYERRNLPVYEYGMFCKAVDAICPGCGTTYLTSCQHGAALDLRFSDTCRRVSPPQYWLHVVSFHLSRYRVYRCAVHCRFDRAVYPRGRLSDFFHLCKEAFFKSSADLST